MAKNKRKLEHDNGWIVLLLGLLIFVILIFALSACNTPKYARKKVQWVERNQPEVLAAYCGSHFPASIGEPYIISTTDTLKRLVPRDCDSLAEMIASKNPNIGLKELIDSLKGYNVNTNSTHTIDSVFVPVRDSAFSSILLSKIDSLSALIATTNITAAKRKTSTNVFMWLFIGLITIDAAVAYFLFRSAFRVKNLL